MMDMVAESDFFRKRRAFYRKTRKGKVVKIVHERYLTIKLCFSLQNDVIDTVGI
jgi:hypothetical protein